MKAQYNGFALEIPSGWVDRTIVTLAEPEAAAGNFLHSLVVVRDVLDAHGSLAEYVKAQVEMLAGRLPGFHLLSKEETNSSGEESQQTVVSWWSQDAGQVVKQIQQYVRRGKLVIILTGTASLETFEQYRPTYESAMSSLGFCSSM